MANVRRRDGLQNSYGTLKRKNNLPEARSIFQLLAGNYQGDYQKHVLRRPITVLLSNLPNTGGAFDDN